MKGYVGQLLKCSLFYFILGLYTYPLFHYLFNCSIKQTAKQSTIWQQLSAFRHVGFVTSPAEVQNKHHTWGRKVIQVTLNAALLLVTDSLVFRSC